MSEELYVCSEEIIERYKKLGSPDVVDALDSLGIDGAIYSLKPLWDDDDHKLVGQARTIKQYATNIGGVYREKYLAHRKAGIWDYGPLIQNILKPGEVIVIDVDGREDIVSWGGTVNSWAITWGAAGAIINGAIRDVSDVESAGNQVFYKSRSPKDSFTRIEAAEAPVQIDGVTIRSGDLIVTDRSGIAVVPNDKIEEALVIAERAICQEAIWTQLNIEHPEMTMDEIFQIVPSRTLNPLYELDDGSIDLEPFKCCEVELKSK